MGVLEGLKELKSKHLTWIKIVKNRLVVFATPMSFMDPKIWWTLSLLSQGLYTVSIKLHNRAKKVINVSSTNIVGDTWALILSRETQPAPPTRNTFPIKTKQKNIVFSPKVRVRGPMHHCLFTESLPQWFLMDSYHQIGHNVELDNSPAGEVLAGISLIFGWLLAGSSDALSNCWARPDA